MSLRAGARTLDMRAREVASLDSLFLKYSIEKELLKLPKSFTNGQLYPEEERTPTITSINKN